MTSAPPLDALEAAALQRLLTTARFGRPLYVLACTASTNDDAKTLAQRGAPEGTVVLAEEQTRGRGRQGRSFASPPGVGIYLSLILRPTLEPSRLPQLTLLAGVAVAETLQEHCALPVTLKWPNDVEVEGKKVAGILSEALFTPGGPPAVIVGIGINVNTAREQFPPELRGRVTSLALAAGHPFTRAPLIASLLAHLERFYHQYQEDGIAAILQRWLHYGRVVGRRVRWVQDQQPREGVVVGLDADGALRVQTECGVAERLLSAEVEFM